MAIERRDVPMAAALHMSAKIELRIQSVVEVRRISGGTPCTQAKCEFWISAGGRQRMMDGQIGIVGVVPVNTPRNAIDHGQSLDL